jgi:hypothetical protein
VRIDPVVLVSGALAVVVLGTGTLLAVTRRAVRRPVPVSRNFLSLPAGLTAAGLLGMALATRPDHRRRLASGGAIVATAVGVAGLLAVWSFESSRDRLVTEGRLFGADADLVWRGEPGDAHRAVDVATSSPGVEAVGVRWGVDADLELVGPDGSTTGTASAFDAVSGWAGPTVVRGRAPADQDEVALGRRMLDELGVDLTDTVSLGGPERRTSLTVVGEVVAWGTDEVDEGIDVSMDGLRRLHADACAGARECAPRVQHVVARLDGAGHDAGALQEAGFTPIPLPPEIGNLHEAGPLPWMLAGFLAALAVAGLLHALVNVL